MSEQSPGALSLGGVTLNDVTRSILRGDVALALGVVAVLTVLILPLPTWLLDIALAISITFSVLVLMTSLFIEKPLDLSSFPTILLVATMLRLSLNMASTRLILANGHEGMGAAGSVIEAFGGFVMGGNFVIGLIVFIILILVNFVVITKGSGRIAEVAARFNLDAMPGKQMAIDADLSAGLIDEEAARSRRKALEEENAFFGSMDGAAKFVRGDAIAGLLITMINIVGGIIVGSAQGSMSLGDAARTYTMLTVGDGLVSQIPALIVSTAAGLLVSKAGVTGSTHKALFGQLGGYPTALAISAFLAAGLALAPGLPAAPFLLMSGGAGYLAYRSNKTKRAALAEADAIATTPEAMPEEAPIAASLQIDEIRLELGYGLLPMVNGEEGARLTDQIKGLRRQLAGEMGFVLPAVRIQDNMQLAANAYMVRIKEVTAGEGELRPNMLLIMDPRGQEIELHGEDTIEPTFGLAAKWIDASDREEAQFRGYTVVDPATVVTTHLTELVRDHTADLLSYAETQKLIDELPQEHRRLVDDVVPGQIPMGGLQRLLQSLLQERVSIRDMPTILEGVSEAHGFTRNIALITEHVRSRLARQLSHANSGPDGVLKLVALTPEWENAFAEALVGEGEEKQLAMPPSQLQQFIEGVRESFDHQALMGETPVLLTSPAIRPYVRSIVERFRPMTCVMSQAEVHPRARIRTVAQI
jgi:flagellar biosynthesis protein FlhA